MSQIQTHNIVHELLTFDLRQRANESFTERNAFEAWRPEKQTEQAARELLERLVLDEQALAEHCQRVRARLPEEGEDRVAAELILAIFSMPAEPRLDLAIRGPECLDAAALARLLMAPRELEVLREEVQTALADGRSPFWAAAAQRHGQAVQAASSPLATLGRSLAAVLRDMGRVASAGFDVMVEAVGLVLRPGPQLQPVALGRADAAESRFSEGPLQGARVALEGRTITVSNLPQANYAPQAQAVLGRLLAIVGDSLLEPTMNDAESRTAVFEIPDDPALVQGSEPLRVELWYEGQLADAAAEARSRPNPPKDQVAILERALEQLGRQEA